VITFVQFKAGKNYVHETENAAYTGLRDVGLGVM
jgi:hypothetical protein